MPREPSSDDMSYAHLFQFGHSDAPSMDERIRIIRTLRGGSPSAARELDRYFLFEVEKAITEKKRLEECLEETRDSHEKLGEVLEKLAGEPWHEAVYLGPAETSRGTMAIVSHGNSRRVVGVCDDVDTGTLQTGDVVFLGSQLNVILERSPHGGIRLGETAPFERCTDDGRLVLKVRDEEIVVEAAGSLNVEKIKAGDQVRWSREHNMAYEVIERSRGDSHFMDEIPTETFTDIGGLDDEIRQIREVIELQLLHGPLAASWGCERKGAILLVGRPGDGKSMVGKAVANWLGTLSKSGRSRFIYVPPSGLNSMWYGQSEAHCRELFRVARQAGAEEPDVPIVMFFEEIDSITMRRGPSIMNSGGADNRLLNSLMAELSGIQERSNIIVMATSNRYDIMDSAMIRPGRLGDLVLRIPPPDVDAAHAIFEKYLPAELPYAANGHGQDMEAARQQLIASATSAIYAPNGNGNLATIKFADGTTRIVKPRDLVSGAVISKIAGDAVHRACWREIKSGERVLTRQDILASVNEQFAMAADVLTRGNVASYVDDLPRGVDVVDVERKQETVTHPHQYRVLEVA